MRKFLIAGGVFVGLVSFLSAGLFQARAQYGGYGAAPDLKQIEKIAVVAPNQLIQKPRQLTFDGPRAGEGYFSADGKKMIFQSERDSKNPFYQMYVLDIETGISKRISTGRGQTTCGWIHPNGKQAMWSSTHLDPEFDQKVKKEFEERNSPVKKRYSWSFDDTYSIFSSDLNGQNLKQLTKGRGYNAEGSYSPDGKTIAFASNSHAFVDEKSGTLSEDMKKKLSNDSSFFMDIYIMDADGKNQRRLTTSAGYDGGPFFSADGKKITWRRFSEDGRTAEIYTMNTDGTDQKAITKLGHMSWAPYFHPSGDYIIFGTSILGMANFELFIVDSEGKQKPVRVSFTDGFDGLASFSPDGGKLTWTHRNDKGESQIYIADWDHDGAKKLLNISTPSGRKPELNPLSFKPTFETQDVKKIVHYLASDYFGGRPTGGARELEYLGELQTSLKSWGLSTELQKFEFTSNVKIKGENTADLKGRFQKSLKYGEDFQIFSSSQSGEFPAAPVVFAGWGIVAPASSEQSAYDSYRDLDVKGKWVFFFADAPKPAAREFKKHTHLMAYARMQHKISVAKNKGAAGVVVIEEGAVGALRFEGSVAEHSLPILKISSSMFAKLLVAHPDIKTDAKKLRDSFQTYEHVNGFGFTSQYFSAKVGIEHIKSSGYNLLARLEPTNPAFKKAPALLIGAHGDHLGLGEQGSSMATGSQKGLIHYGADDNASGVSGVIELAHYFSTDANRKNLKKPIQFAIWSGEEIGILGSSHFVKNYKDQFGRNFEKAFEAGLNMDMIGRVDASTQQLQVQGLGSAKNWSRVVEEVAAKSNLHLVVTSDPYLPTDSMAVYVGKVPSISFFTGAHLEYHTPNDTPEKINFEGLVDVIKTVQVTAEILATSSGPRVQYNHVEGSGMGAGSNRSFRIFLGTIPDYSQEGVKGVRISGTSKNSPAELAGLKPGDVIVEFDKVPVENIYDYVYTLQTVKPDVTTKIKIVRKDQTVELEITPKLKE